MTCSSLYCFGEMPQLQPLNRKGTYSGFQFYRDAVHDDAKDIAEGGEDMVAGIGGCWSHCTYTSEAKRE